MHKLIKLKSSWTLFRPSLDGFETQYREALTESLLKIFRTASQRRAAQTGRHLIYRESRKLNSIISTSIRIKQQTHTILGKHIDITNWMLQLEIRSHATIINFSLYKHL